MPNYRPLDHRFRASRNRQLACYLGLLRIQGSHGGTIQSDMRHRNYVMKGRLTVHELLYCYHTSGAHMDLSHVHGEIARPRYLGVAITYPNSLTQSVITVPRFLQKDTLWWYFGILFGIKLCIFIDDIGDYSYYWILQLLWDTGIIIGMEYYSWLQLLWDIAVLLLFLLNTWQDSQLDIMWRGMHYFDEDISVPALV